MARLAKDDDPSSLSTEEEEAIIAASASDRAGQTHGAVGACLRERLPDLRRRAIAGNTRGDLSARALARLMDQIIRILCTVSDFDEHAFALCAVGGYGRGELAPFSDIDLLFLHDGKNGSALEGQVNAILYPLWDGGLKLGHGVMTPKEAIELAKNDIVARTAYLDGRFLFGNAEIDGEFLALFDKLRKKTKSEFVAAKLSEQDARQLKAEETRYLVEPDIKEGKGGFRDLQTIRWIYKYVYAEDDDKPQAPTTKDELAETRALIRAEQFLWSVRVHLHDLRGRAEEKLTFDIQPAVADRLGYHDRAGMTAAERLMKRYFVNAAEVGRLTRILCSRLEDARAKRRPSLPRFLPKSLQRDEAPGKPNLKLSGGRLDFEDAAKARNTPRDAFRFFRAFAKKPSVDFHPDALDVIGSFRQAAISKIRDDPVIATLFAKILTATDDPVQVLRAMAEAGLLGKYIPAFGGIIGRIDYGLYRRFTMDESVLRAVGVLKQIETGALAAQHPHATQILGDAEHVLPFFLAVFFHETAWTVKDFNLDVCERRVAADAKRLGLSDEDAARVGWVASRYAVMIRTAEWRNLADARAISNFARVARDRACLDLMLVVAVCHCRTVGFYSWDEIKRRRLTELYQGAIAWLEGGDDRLNRKLADNVEQVRKDARQRLKDWAPQEADAFMARLTPSMLGAVDSDILVRFAHLARAADASKAQSAVKVTPRDQGVEAIIYANDRRGLLADLSGAVAASGLSVRSVKALTTADGKVLDVFSLQAADAGPIDDEGGAERLHAALLAAASDAPASRPDLKRRLGDRREIFTVEPVVRIELAASQDATVIETEGLDRPGLLYELADALSSLDVTIASAHVATYGETAVDVFYLRNRENRKITDPDMLSQVKARLMVVLGASAAR
ncbi:MAG: [protein-PII] uridylyltransferase [Pseudomonadota bacterium]